MQDSPVGLIGVGLLGTALAERLRSAGFGVVGFDVDATRHSALSTLGGEIAESIGDVARRTRRIMLSLPDSSISGDVIDELVDGGGPIQLVIDTTTGSPEDAQLAGQRLGQAQIAFLDATIAGSSQHTRAGEALIMVGGEAEDLAMGRDLLEAIGQQWFHVGSHGTGASMKLVVNLAIGLHRAVLAEALTFGEALGFPPDLVLDVLRAGPAHSRMMDSKGAKMVNRDFAPQARLRQHLKDVHLMLDEATRHAARVPFTERHVQLLEALVARGHGDEDNSAIVRAFQPAPDER